VRPRPTHAISLKQPWAALLLAGLKTIEVRTWPAYQRRGPLWIHVSRTIDPRPEGWAHIRTPALEQLATPRGGLLGIATLVDCIPYPNPAAFLADQSRHFNEPSWYVESGMYGLEFTAPEVVPLIPYRGNTFFFPVEGLPSL